MISCLLNTKYIDVFFAMVHEQLEFLHLRSWLATCVRGISILCKCCFHNLFGGRLTWYPCGLEHNWVFRTPCSWKLKISLHDFCLLKHDACFEDLLNCPVTSSTSCSFEIGRELEYGGLNKLLSKSWQYVLLYPVAIITLQHWIFLY